MKSVSALEAQSDIQEVLNTAQGERVVITRDGKPSAVIVGIESYDEEDLQLAKSSDFWRMIEERRSGSSIPLSDLKARLESQDPSK